MKEEILERIEDIEREENVRIFYACESGSRAWGFPSSNSDFDVRFVYLHPMEWYLSIDLERKRDVIERLIDHNLDINGWDLRKALRLLRKGNPPFMEWLGSPIIYREHFTITTQMRDLMLEYHAPIVSSYHYYRMAKGNYRDYLRGKIVWIKKYFYVLRPLLAVRWIEQDLGVVPTDFQILVDKAIDSPELKRAIQDLIVSKRSGEELDRGPRIAPISDFVESELTRLESIQFEHKYQDPVRPARDFDRVFLSALDEVWSRPVTVV